MASVTPFLVVVRSRCDDELVLVHEETHDLQSLATQCFVDTEDPDLCLLAEDGTVIATDLGASIPIHHDTVFLYGRTDSNAMREAWEKEQAVARVSEGVKLSEAVDFQCCLLCCRRRTAPARHDRRKS